MARSAPRNICLAMLGLLAAGPLPATAATPQLKAAADHAVLLKQDGTVWQWGVVGYGREYNSSTSSYKNTTPTSGTPVQVAGLGPVASIATGGTESIALTTSGTVWAFGRDPQINWSCRYSCSLITPRLTVWQIKDPLDPGGFLTNVTAIWASSGSYFAQKADGTVWAWGNNNTDKLGGNPPGKPTYSKNPPPDVATIAAPIQVRRGISYPSAIASGVSHTLALSGGGGVQAWGGDAYGERGDGSYNHSGFPYWDGHVWYDQPTSSSITGATAIVAGAYKSLALKGDGTVWAWGQNTNGELGSNIPWGGSTDGSNTPVQVAGISGTAAAVALGSHHSVVLLASGTVWAMGQNGGFALGAPAQVGRSTTPLQVPNLTGVTAIDAGGECSTALKSDGTVWEWGNCPDGHLGATPWQVGFGGPALSTPFCGAALGQSFGAAPTANLCLVGTASQVAGTGPWSWTCTAPNGASASCFASAGSRPANYVGCYIDGEARALPVQLMASGATVESCSAAAKAKGYAYAGVQYSGACFAGDGLGLSRAPEGECNTPCTANKNEMCGGSWRNSIYATGVTPAQPSAPVYQGCYKDDATRALPVVLMSSSVGTLETCVAAARARGLLFAGLQFHGQCYGGNALKYAKTSDDDCKQTSCDANPAEYCGGAWLNAIYGTGATIAAMPPASAYQGCFKDTPARTLPVALMSSGATIESCVAAANKIGFTYAGLQWHGQCFAGDALPPASTKVADAQCDTKCDASLLETCGGGWLNSVWKAR